MRKPYLLTLANCHYQHSRAITNKQEIHSPLAPELGTLVLFLCHTRESKDGTVKPNFSCYL